MLSQTKSSRAASKFWVSKLSISGPEKNKQVAAGDPTINGVMIESFLIEGNQPAGPRETLTYGQSITDACIGWETTVQVLDEGVAAARARRSKNS